MAALEKNTNELFRKKYYVDATEILTNKKKQEKPVPYARSPIIDASKVVVSTRTVRLRRGSKDAGEQIRVNVIREGNRIKSIRIACPCGRHAELDCEYAPEEQKAK